MSTTRTSRSEAPLRAWGEALRARRARQFRVRKALLPLGVLTGALVWTTLSPPAPRLVWNASASAPTGLYGVRPGAQIRTGDMVIARLAKPWRDLAAARRYLPSNVPLVKRVAAGPGQEVCALGPLLYLDGRPLAHRLAWDRAGRVMPWWQGCMRLGQGQYLLLMAGNRSSFDGRYFGVTQRTEIIGRANLLWAR
ncbi:S26 family signal peptidase [Novosphingobium gossypii]|uniref:S26 family signal peptidase n=1 Tax=Novosphingobium gossypii TaxID=1604774 RepID=UPI003D24EBCE